MMFITSNINGRLIFVHDLVIFQKIKHFLNFCVVYFSQRASCCMDYAIFVFNLCFIPNLCVACIFNVATASIP
uniref:Putative uncharacterized protein YGR270C-A n=1 Tax=Saccharomyces cerevisiae (strain ATCC 204508 / S288c) TaxID=559292 RepID=YG270_YEAST|nr:RecName: Full=Putative uncharacterized protein YGR270C-A [Saccharomyces cerevisiae S288C]AAL79265.1 unknown [Saccharomyces cerevisiae]